MKFEGKTAKIRIVDDQGHIIAEVEGLAQTIELKPIVPEGENRVIKLSEAEPPSVTWKFGPLPKEEYRKFTRLIGLDPLWNAWISRLRRFVGRN